MTSERRHLVGDQGGTSEWDECGRIDGNQRLGRRNEVVWEAGGYTPLSQMGVSKYQIDFTQFSLSCLTITKTRRVTSAPVLSSQIKARGGGLEGEELTGNRTK